MSAKPINRWLVLVSSVVEFCASVRPMPEVFQGPLIDRFHWSTSATSLAFTLALSIVPLAMIVAGRIQDRIGPHESHVRRRNPLWFGNHRSRVHEFLGSSLCDVRRLGWNGHRNDLRLHGRQFREVLSRPRGLASGLIAAGFGSGAVLFAPLATYLIGRLRRAGRLPPIGSGVSHSRPGPLLISLRRRDTFRRDGSLRPSRRMPQRPSRRTGDKCWAIPGSTCSAHLCHRHAFRPDDHCPRFPYGQEIIRLTRRRPP